MKSQIRFTGQPLRQKNDQKKNCDMVVHRFDNGTTACFYYLSSVLHHKAIHLLQSRPSVFEEAFVGGAEVIFIGTICGDRFAMTAAAVSAKAEPLAGLALLGDLHGPLDEAGFLTPLFHGFEAVGSDVT